jgi:acyl-CoA thioesterase-1
VHYLALGDSYTIGTGVGPDRAFPPRLARHVEAATGEAVEVVNLGVNGYTSEDLVRHELPHLGDRAWDLVTVLIGVNDFVQGRTVAAYSATLGRIYAALAGLGLPRGRVVAVSIPDFSYTPAAPAFGIPAEIEAGLRAVNAEGREQAQRAGLAFVDIFEPSRSGITEPGWVAGDGLHPGEPQLQAWADTVWGHLITAPMSAFL